MVEPEIYYYLRRMDEDLQDELRPKLENCINLDKISIEASNQVRLMTHNYLETPPPSPRLIKFLPYLPPAGGGIEGGSRGGVPEAGRGSSESLSAIPRVGLIHASQRHNADLKQKIQALNLDLIVFLIQGAGKPKEATKKIKEEFPNIQRIWECGTEYLIEYFDKFEQYIRENSVQDWQLQGWIATDIKQLSALALLCQGYLAIYAAEEDGEQFDGMNRLPEPIFSSIRKNLKIKQEQVCQASWWLNVFGLWDEQSQTIISEKWRNFERSLAEEWGAVATEPFPEVLTQLLEAIHNCPGELKQPERVANAYRAIASVLEGSYR